MTLLFWIVGAIAVLLFLYLFAAMLKPELFS
ncbi:MAG TPA: K(+)-transporting ATPase subunit F [Gemmatimonadales bacterium]|nr:K(+)-transporting ATPase subunit F [Gemmatimonadales bacterium]